MKKEDKKKDSIANKAITWFKGLQTKWKVVVVILLASIVFSIPYVLSGQYSEDVKRQEAEQQAREEKAKKEEEKKEKEDKQKEEQVARLNKWFKDEYIPSNPLYDENGEFDVYSLKIRTIKGFKLDGDDILIIIDHNRMKAEGFTVEELVNWGYSALLEYDDKEPLHFDNFDSDDYINKRPQKYDVYYE